MRLIFAAFVLSSFCCARSIAEDWPTFMQGPQRAGGAAGATAPKSGRKVWSFNDADAPGAFAGSPAVADGRVYVGSDNKKLYCFDADTGRRLWSFQAVAEVFASPAIVDGRLYLGVGLHEFNNAKLYCLDAKTGRRIWAFQTKSHVEFGPTVFAGRIYFGAGDDGVYCLDAVSGKQIWRFDGVHVDMCPVVTADGVFFGNVYGKSAFYRLNPNSGKLIWRTPAEQEVCGSPSIDGNRIYFGMGNGSFTMSHAEPTGAVACLSADDGKVQWTFRPKDTVLTCVALANGAAYFGSRDGNFYCVDLSNGKLRWKTSIGEPILSSPAIAGGRVCFGCDDGQIYCLNAATGGKIWSYDASREAFNTDVRIFGSPAIYRGKVYVGSMNFHFLCLGEAK